MRKLPIVAVLVVFALNVQAQTFQWAKLLGTPPYFIAPSNFGFFQIAHDHHGHIYTIGHLGGTLDLDPGSSVHSVTSAGGDNLFIQKLDSARNFIWVRNIDRSPYYGGYTHSEALSTMVDKEGSVTIAGYFQGSLDFDPGSGTTVMSCGANSNGFVLKIDSSGNFLWAAQFFTAFPYSSVVRSAAIDDSGNVICLISFNSTTDVDPGVGTQNVTTTASDQTCIVKLDSAGNFRWVREFHSTDKIIGRAIACGAGNRLFLTGEFRGTADFDPGAPVYNINEATNGPSFIEELDAAGNFLWVRSFGTCTGYSSFPGYSPYSQSYHIVVDKQNNIHLYGEIWGNVNFGTATTPHYLYLNRGTYLVKLDSAGSFLWASLVDSAYQGSNYESFSVDSMSNIYITGRFFGTTDFDPGLGVYDMTASGPSSRSDIFLQKLAPNGNFLWAKQLGSSGDDNASVVDVDEHMCIYIAGYIQSTVDFDPGPGTYFMTGRSSPLFSFFQEKLSQCTTVTPNVSINGNTGMNAMGLITDTFTAIATCGGTAPVFQWYINGTLVTGATSTVFIFNTLHNNDSVYCVLTSNDTCAISPISISDTLVVNVPYLGLSNPKLPPDFYIYPNPCGGDLTIVSGKIASGEKTVAYRISDISGRVMQQGGIQINGNFIDNKIRLSESTAEGIYFITITVDDINKTERLIIQR